MRGYWVNVHEKSLTTWRNRRQSNLQGFRLMKKGSVERVNARQLSIDSLKYTSTGAKRAVQHGKVGGSV
jgi:hypothetical protein